jgi:hypothetical protein
MSSPTLTFTPAMFHAAYVTRKKTVTRRLIAGLDAKSIKRFDISAAHQRFVAVLHSGMVVDFGKPAHTAGQTKPIVTSWAVDKAFDAYKPSELHERPKLKIWFDNGSKKPAWAGKSRPARFLPKSLYHLAPQVRIISARPEPLHSISPDDAAAEGITKVSKDNGRTWKHGLADRDGLPGGCDIGWEWQKFRSTAVQAYYDLWDTIHPAHPADTNPIVWRYEFTVL